MKNENSLSNLIQIIPWNSIFMRFLIIFDILMLFFTIFIIKFYDIRIFWALFCSLLAFLSEKINKFLSENFQSLKLKNSIFDENGLFIFFFFALPMSFNLFLILLFFLKDLIFQLSLNLKLKKVYNQKQQQNVLKNKKNE